MMDFALFASMGAAFLVGLMGGVHCIGMCGGIVGALGLNTTAKSPSLHTGIPILLGYNIGRISSYSIAGALVAGLGAGLLQMLPMDGLRWFFNTMAAFFIIALGLYLSRLWQGIIYLERLGHPLWQQLEPLGRRFLPVSSIHQAIFLGFIWGWLPCGLVYSVLIWTLSVANPLQGALIMFSFGLGTLPNLLLMGIFSHQLRSLLQHPRIGLAAGLFVVFLGMLLLLRANF